MMMRRRRRRRRRRRTSLRNSIVNCRGRRWKEIRV
jgi:hypothetical protein